ncbi:hypothetical protein [Salipaludibacillus daqingensis]|uniref:hypothetical protein n=1 Tax=Salipaludibacillus daqingensis TaxID=3041001 RepID=UPI0024742676|nr:hypothetical protein [Salipaludibacillus daqingensis]
MNKTLFSTMIACFLLISCSDESSVEQVNNLEDTDDVETLISTNEKLVEQLEKELAEKDQLQERIVSLENENKDLKDDILTYKQQAIELEEMHHFELSLRHDLDILARQFFQSMHEEQHEKVEEVISTDIEVDAEDDTLKITEQDGIERSFHYLQLDSVVYIRQKSFSYDHDDEIFISRYEFYSATEEDEKINLEGGVEIIFINDVDWKVSSIRYVQ